MTGTRTSRRAFLRRAGIGAAGLALGGPALLAGCSKSSPAALRQVRVTNLPLQIDDNTPHLFEAATGIFLRYTEYTDAEQYLTNHARDFASGSDVGADVVILPDRQAARLVSEGWVRPLPALAHRTRLLPAFAKPGFDPGRRFSLPYSSTIVGLAFDRSRVASPVRSAAALFDARFAGKVTLAADPAATLGLVTLAQGDDPQTVTASQALAAVGRVRDAVASGQVGQFATTEAVDDVVSGRALVAVVRSDAARIARRHHKSLEFVVPVEGGLLESIDMLVPKGVQALPEAAAFIDYVYEPDVDARFASFVGRVMPVAGAIDSLRTIDPNAASDPLVEPDAPTWARLRCWGGNAATAAAVTAFDALVKATPRPA